MKPDLQFNQSDRSLNRAYETRRDSDNFKTPSIDIYDVDYAIHYFLSKKIDPKVEQNRRMVDVPVVFASAEIWNQVQAKGYMRDRKGMLLTPYAILRRVSMSEDDRFKKLDVNVAPEATNVKIVAKDPRQFENRFDLHSKTTNSSPSTEFYISVVPEFYKVEYELILYTSTTKQMNTLVQDIMVTSNFVWGDSFEFRTLVGDFTFDTLNISDEERVVKATTNLTVDARFQNDFELRKSSIQKAFSIKRLVFKTERSSFDIRAVDHFPGENT